MGRPTRYTPEVVTKITNAIRAGNYREPAARMAGVSPTSLYAWQARYPEFAEAIQKAEAEAEGRMVAIVAAAAPKSWQAAAWWLERKQHERWMRRDRIEQTGAEGGPIQVNAFAGMDLAERREALARLVDGDSKSDA